MKNFLSTKKGKIIAGAVTLAVIAGVVVLIILLNTGYRNIRVADLTGTSKVTAGLSVSDAFKGQNLKNGESVEVFEKSSLTLALDSDKHVVASELTKFRLEAFGAAGKDSRTVIHLEKGTISNEIDNKLLPSESYVVESPNASMSVRGTIFTVNVYFDEKGLCHTFVEVKEGTVELTDKDTGKVKTLNVGESADVVSRSSREPDSIPTVSSDIKPVGGDSGGSGQTLTSGDYEYRYNETLGGIEITKYLGNDEELNIPAIIDGKNVVCIGKRSFNYIKSTSVVIPNGVTLISDWAFFSCLNLKSVSIPESVTEIGEYAFRNCIKLENLELSHGVQKIGKEAFYCCSAIKRIELPDSVTDIEEHAFAECTALTGITIPNSVKKIGQEAFLRCGRLTDVTWPDSITTITTGAFSRCVGLQNFTIPDGVTEIGDNAFFDCFFLKSITIPDTVRTIGESSFYNCTQLDGVEIPDSVTRIEKDAFYCCRGKINYKGQTYTDADNYYALYQAVNGS